MKSSDYIQKKWLFGALFGFKVWLAGISVQYVSKSGRKLPKKNQCVQYFVWRSIKRCSVSHIILKFKLYNKKEIKWKNILCVLFTFTFETTKWATLYHYARKLNIISSINYKIAIQILKESVPITLRLDLNDAVFHKFSCRLGLVGCVSAY